MKLESVVFKDAVRIGNDQFGSATSGRFELTLDTELRVISATVIGKKDYSYIPLENVKYFKHEEANKGRKESTTSRAS